jgi:hypothetical protein
MHNMDRAQIGYGQEMGDFEFSSGEGVFNEQEQTELAADLLEVSSDAEMEQFLGDLISKAGSAIGSFVSSPTGQAIGSVLKGAAKQLLPVAGQALGGYLGGGAGAQIGGQLGSAASGLFEAESEDREWESANTFVRLAADTVKNALQAAGPGANPRAVAQQALAAAAQAHAPGLVTQAQGGHPETGGGTGHGRSGRWVRRGNHIVLMGA